MRSGVVVILLSLVLASPAAAHERGAFWTTGKAMTAVDHATVRVGRTMLRVKAETTLCSGEGRVLRRQGRRTWKHFRCTFTTFTTSGGVGRDVDFRVHVLDSRRISITDGRWIVG